MRLLTSWIIAFVLVLPVPALAQTLKPADIVGTWVIPHDGKEWSDSLRGKLMLDMLTLNADGSYTREMKKKEGESLVSVWKKAAGTGDTVKLRWELVGDTIRFDKSYDSHRVVLKGGRLLWWTWDMWDSNRRYEQCADQVFERFDASKPLTLPPPPPITIQPADLVGTWAGRNEINERMGTVNDTLVIGADYTIRVVHVGPPDDVYVKGTWSLLPGDVLTNPWTGRQKIVLQNGELIRCRSSYFALLKRIAP